jgi:multidrug resistance efflux pump
VAGEFVELTERTRGLLDYFARGLLSGEMSTIDGAIRRLDTPVTPVDTKVEKAPQELSRWYPVQKGLRYGLYLLLGALLTWYVGSTTYYRVWRLQVSTASVVAQMELLRSPKNGNIEELLVGEGQLVEQGDALFRVVDEDAQTEDLELQRQVDRAERALLGLEGQHAVEVEKIEIYRGVLEAQVMASSARLGHLQQNGRLLRKQRDRTLGLVESGALSDRAVDMANADYETSLAQIQLAIGEAQVSAANLAALDDGFLFEGERLQANLPELESQIELARADLIFARKEALSRRAQEGVVVTAPFSGRVSALFKSPQTSAKQGDEILMLEKNEARRVEAWLTPEEASFIKLHDAVEVEIRAMGRTFVGQVVSLGSPSSEVEASRLLGKDPKLRVGIDLVGLAQSSGYGASFDGAMKELVFSNSVGLPVTVTFRRAWD